MGATQWFFTVIALAVLVAGLLVTCLRIVPELSLIHI